MASAPRGRMPAPRVRAVIALAYRAICEKPEAVKGEPERTISRDAFRGQLELIRARRAPVSTIRDLCESNGYGKPRAKTGEAVVLTFDGGSASHVDPVLPLLWERRMPGEFFINPAFVGRRGYVSWSELRGMASAGMSVQSHGYSHRPLDTLDDRGLVNELARSKGVIEDRLGQRVTVFAAPYGSVNRDIAGKAYELGYRAVCSSAPGYWEPAADRVLIPRLLIRPATTERTLRGWLDRKPLALAAERCRHRALQLMRAAIGDAALANLRQRYMKES